MTKYEHIDRLITQQIARGNRTLTQLIGTPAWTEAKRIDGEYARQPGPDRIMDRRLQALRKRRLIEYSKGAWRIVELSTGSEF